LYYEDRILWCEQQAALLREIGPSYPALDWQNIVEMIEGFAEDETRTVEDMLSFALGDMLKLEGWPNARDAPKWREAILDHRSCARNWSTPAMRRRIDMAKIFGWALKNLPAEIDGEAPRLPLHPNCPATLDELLVKP